MTQSDPNPAQPSGSQTTPNDDESEFVWSYRGYRLRTPEFVTAMVHYFRAEVQRANIWRTQTVTRPPTGR